GRRHWRAPGKGLDCPAAARATDQHGSERRPTRALAGARRLVGTPLRSANRAEVRQGQAEATRGVGPGEDPRTGQAGCQGVALGTSCARVTAWTWSGEKVSLPRPSPTAPLATPALWSRRRED